MKINFYRCIAFAAIVLVGMASCAEDNQEAVEVTDAQENMTFPNYSTTPIDGQYFVILHDNQINFRIDPDDYEGAQAAMRKEAISFLAQYKLSEEDLDRTYTMALTGFTARISKEKIHEISTDPRVKYVEQDRMGMLGRPIDHPRNQPEEPLVNTQSIPWGIKRVGGPFQYSGRHSVFILDTGIDLNHPDLNIDTQKGFDPYNRFRKDWNFNDEHGHGTHVAGTVGALDNHFGVVGVAAGVPVVPIKIFFGPWAAYTYSGMVAGIEHLGVRGIPGDVANLSFGGFDESRVLDDALLNVSEKRRIWMVIASGNSALPATAFSPARVVGNYTITVSAIDSRDRRAWFSHYGEPIKYAAPGVNVVSTWRGGGYSNQTGTSMSAPHVSGLRVLGDIDTDGYSIDWVGKADPIAYRR
jgi:subtilisin family serine protease